MTAKLTNRRIKDIAYPLLYRYISLEDVYTLKHLATSMRSSSLPLASWVRVLQVEHCFTSDEYDSTMMASDLTALVVGAINLEDISLPRDVFPSTMEVVGCISRSSLRRLRLELNDNSLPCLRLVGFFINLQMLDLDMHDVNDPIPGDIADWRLPSLKTLEVTGPPYFMDESLTLFLCTCSFDCLKNLTYDVVPDNKEHAISIAKLFKRCTVLKYLLFGVDDPDVFHAIPPSVRKLAIQKVSGQTFAHIPYTITDIVLDYKYAAYSEEDLWEALKAMLKLKPQSHLSRIQVGGFLWMESASEVDHGHINWGSHMYRITGRMLRYARELLSKGVTLVDEGEKSVVDYFLEA
jgi:hypothetical protein